MGGNEKMGRRLFILALALLSLTAGMWGGITRLGWWIPAGSALPLQHGPLMVSGFLGTLISLERSVALGWRWALLVPALTGLGSMMFHGGYYGPGVLTITVGSGGLLTLSGLALRRRTDLPLALMATGASSWLAGNLLWFSGQRISRAVPFWAGFLILTIVGERLELNRFTIGSTVRLRSLWPGLALLPGGLLLYFFWEWGVRWAGAGMIAMSAWLLVNDLAWLGLSGKAPDRFRALSLLLGFVWLGLAGVQWVLFGNVGAGPRYDALIHSVFLGFTFSMFFAHALIIFPILIKRQFRFGHRLYLPLILLQLSTALRVGCDLAGWWRDRQFGEMISGLFLQGQKIGGLFNVISILLFMACLMSLKTKKK